MVQSGMSSPLKSLVRVMALTNLASGWTAAPRHSASAKLRDAGTIVNGKLLNPLALRLRTAALRKKTSHTESAEKLGQRVELLARAASESSLQPSQASDLIDSIPRAERQWSKWERQVAVALVRSFAKEGIVVRRETFSTLVDACRLAGELPVAMSLLECLHSVGLCSDPHVYADLMADLCGCGRAEEAVKLEEAMRAAGASPTNQTLTILISSLIHSQEPILALQVVNELRSRAASYDLPLYTAMVQAMFAGGARADVDEIFEEMRAKGMWLSERTHNVILQGYINSRPGYMGDAIQFLDSFIASGGMPTVISYNLVLAGYARMGELSKCEKILANLRQHLKLHAPKSPAIDTGRSTSEMTLTERLARLADRSSKDPKDPKDPFAPDAYTYNAMMQACLLAGRPRRALAYRRVMALEGVNLDSVSLMLLADAYSELGMSFQVFAEVRKAIQTGDVARLSLECYNRLLQLCAQLSFNPDEAPAAREEALWLEEQYQIEHVHELAFRICRRRATQRAANGPPVKLYSSPWAVRNLLCTLANAGDFQGARRVFECTQYPRPNMVWSEMIRVCNLADKDFAQQMFSDFPDLGIGTVFEDVDGFADWDADDDWDSWLSV